MIKLYNKLYLINFKRFYTMTYDPDFMEEWCGDCERGTKGEGSSCNLCGSSKTIPYNTKHQTERMAQDMWKRRYG